MSAPAPAVCPCWKPRAPPPPPHYVVFVVLSLIGEHLSSYTCYNGPFSARSPMRSTSLPVELTRQCVCVCRTGGDEGNEGNYGAMQAFTDPGNISSGTCPRPLPAPSVRSHSLSPSSSLSLSLTLSLLSPLLSLALCLSNCLHLCPSFSLLRAVSPH